MKKTSIDFLTNACKGEILGNKDAFVCDIKIDSREAQSGDMFVCVAGENNDGHRFAESAYNNGCRIFLMSERDVAESLVSTHSDCSVILCDNTIFAFEQMAKAYINQFEIRKAAVTGSVGKTTTKMLTAAVLSAKYNTICTKKNLNTNLGLCLTCFMADDSTEAIVFEMGMDAKNQISEYVSFVEPELAIITNVGVSHMERLGSRDAIADAKLEITGRFTDNNMLVVNADSDYLRTEEEIRSRSVCKENYSICLVNATREIKDKGLEGVEFDYGGVSFKLPLIGIHNVTDACLAIEAGRFFGVKPKDAAEVLAKVEATDRRLHLERIGGITLLDDSYNASPDSMKAAIAALESADGNRKIAILSDMYELGEAEEEGHYEVGRCVGEHKIDYLILAGENASFYSAGVMSVKNSDCAVIEVGTNLSAAEMAKSLLKDGDVVLVKGSNGTKISDVAEFIRKEFLNA